MGYEFLCHTSDVELGTMKAFETGGKKVILFHISEGFFATQAKCTHLFLPLEKGAIIDDCRIQCKFHHAEFDIKTGEPEVWASYPPGIQALNFMRGEKALKTYAIQTSDDDDVLIDISQDASHSKKSEENVREKEPA